MSALASWLLAASLAASEPVPSPAAHVPPAVGRALRTKFRSWRVAEPRYIHPTPAKPRPPVTFGDFDGDGRRDAAVMLALASRPETRILVIVFDRREGQVAQYVSEAFDWIDVHPAGTKDYDHTHGREITYRHDTVMTAIDAKSAYSLVYRDGRFHALLTAD